MGFWKWGAITGGALAALYLGGALSLVLKPFDTTFDDAPMTEAQWIGLQRLGGGVNSQDTPYREASFTARDGETIAARRYGPEQSETAIVLVHGVASDASWFNNAAGLLVAATDAEIITPDLRGHGASGGRPFDVDYTGQYEDDIADVIDALQSERRGRSILLAGHSMGGGIALRYALLKGAPQIDGYVLFAPNFGEGPTRRKPNPDAPKADGFVRFSLGRTIGLLMLNGVGITALDHLPTLAFNAPPAMPVYSYRAMMNGQPNAPEDAPVALQAIDEPLLVIVGSHDEVFYAPGFAEVVEANSDGEVFLIDGATHQSVVNDPRSFEIIERWMRAAY